MEKQLKDIDHQINNFIELISVAKHQRPLLEKLDKLEENRILLKEKLDIKKFSACEPKLLDTDINSLRNFMSEYRQNLDIGEPETKKAILKSVISSATFACVVPTLCTHRWRNVLKSKKKPLKSEAYLYMASPRGVEPLLPP